MTNKTLWIAFVVIFIIAQALGFVVHQMLLAETYAPHYGSVFRPEAQLNEMMWMMMIGGAIYLYLFCYIFTKGYEGKGVMEGVRYGLLMGLFLSIPMAVDSYVVYPLSMGIAATWFVSGVIMFMIFGAILAAIYKPKTVGPF